MATIFYINTDYQKTNAIILLTAINCVLIVGSLLFSIILYLDNKNTLSIATIVILVISLVLGIIVFINVRKSQQYIAPKEVEVEVGATGPPQIITIVQPPPPPPEPDIYTSNLTTTLTKEYVPINGNNVSLLPDILR
jgi:hypothetical protein